MNLFTMDLDRATYDDIETFCRENLPENIRLDYKRELSTTGAREQVIKGVSALANTQGGILLYGIGTSGSSRYPKWPSEGMSALSDFERRIISWCVEHISPPIVPFVKWVDNASVAGKGFGIVRVEMSWHSPHTIDGGSSFYVRRRDSSQPLPATLFEIESMQNLRAATLERDRKHLDDLRLRIGPGAGGHPHLILLLLPSFAREDVLQLQNLPAVVRQLQDIGIRDDLVRTLRSYSQGVLSLEVPNWRFALTSKGAMGLCFVHPEATNDGIDLASLVKWVSVATSTAKILSEQFGHWGVYQVEFDAKNYYGVRVLDSVSGREFSQPCRDSNIYIRREWPVLELKSDPLKLGTDLFQRIMWSFGQHDSMWSETTIRNRLDRSS